MVIDLGKFMGIWILIIITFSSVGTLLFGELKKFHDPFNVLVIYFESAIGNWDLDIYRQVNVEGVHNYTLEYVGIIYHNLFLLINGILLLNLVIAILSSVYETYKGIASGLYYNVLIE